MARARTAPPSGYYIVETERGRFTPFHLVTGLMFDDEMARRWPGALVPVGPSQSKYIRAVRFCYERAGVPWDSRKTVMDGASGEAPHKNDAREGKAPEANAGRLVSGEVAHRQRKRAS